MKTKKFTAEVKTISDGEKMQIEVHEVKRDKKKTQEGK